MIGIFLAVLELIRHHSIQCEQEELFGEMWLLPVEKMGADLDLTSIDAYDHSGPDSSRES